MSTGTITDWLTDIGLPQYAEMFVLREADIEDEQLPYLLLLLGIQEGTAGLRAMSPETIKVRTFDALRRVLISASRSRPLILAIRLASICRVSSCRSLSPSSAVCMYGLKL